MLADLEVHTTTQFAIAPEEDPQNEYHDPDINILTLWGESLDLEKPYKISPKLTLQYAQPQDASEVAALFLRTYTKEPWNLKYDNLGDDPQTKLTDKTTELINHPGYKAFVVRETLETGEPGEVKGYVSFYDGGDKTEALTHFRQSSIEDVLQAHPFGDDHVDAEGVTDIAMGLYNDRIPENQNVAFVPDFLIAEEAQGGVAFQNIVGLLFAHITTKLGPNAMIIGQTMKNGKEDIMFKELTKFGEYMDFETVLTCPVSTVPNHEHVYFLLQDVFKIPNLIAMAFMSLRELRETNPVTYQNVCNQFSLDQDYIEATIRESRSINRWKHEIRNTFFKGFCRYAKIAQEDFNLPENNTLQTQTQEV